MVFLPDFWEATWGTLPVKLRVFSDLWGFFYKMPSVYWKFLEVFFFLKNSLFLLSFCKKRLNFLKIYQNCWKFLEFTEEFWRFQSNNIELIFLISKVVSITFIFLPKISLTFLEAALSFLNFFLKREKRFTYPGFLFLDHDGGVPVSIDCGQGLLAEFNLSWYSIGELSSSEERLQGKRYHHHKTCSVLTALINPLWWL